MHYYQEKQKKTKKTQKKTNSRPHILKAAETMKHIFLAPLSLAGASRPREICLHYKPLPWWIPFIIAETGRQANHDAAMPCHCLHNCLTEMTPSGHAVLPITSIFFGMRCRCVLRIVFRYLMRQRLCPGPCVDITCALPG